MSNPLHPDVWPSAMKFESGTWVSSTDLYCTVLEKLCLRVQNAGTLFHSFTYSLSCTHTRIHTHANTFILNDAVCLFLLDFLLTHIEIISMAASIMSGGNKYVCGSTSSVATYFA